VCRGIDIEMQLGMLDAQLAESGEEALRREQRQDAEPQSQHVGAARHHLDRVGQAVERGRDLLEQPLAIAVEHDRLVPAVEQWSADEALERLDAPAQRGRDRASSCDAALIDPSRATCTNASIAVKGGNLRMIVRSIVRCIIYRAL